MLLKYAFYMKLMVFNVLQINGTHVFQVWLFIELMVFWYYPHRIQFTLVETSSAETSSAI